MLLQQDRNSESGLSSVSLQDAFSAGERVNDLQPVPETESQQKQKGGVQVPSRREESSGANPLNHAKLDVPQINPAARNTREINPLNDDVQLDVPQTIPTPEKSIEIKPKRPQSAPRQREAVAVPKPNIQRPASAALIRDMPQDRPFSKPWQLLDPFRANIFDVFNDERITVQPNSDNIFVVITIEHCTDCANHNITTRHKQQKYDDFAQNLLTKLSLTHPDIPVLACPINTSEDTRRKQYRRGLCLPVQKGSSPSMVNRPGLYSRLGAFEVEVHVRNQKGAVLHSKLWTKRWPNTEKTLRRLDFHLKEVAQHVGTRAGLPARDIKQTVNNGVVDAIAYFSKFETVL